MDFRLSSYADKFTQISVSDDTTSLCPLEMSLLSNTTAVFNEAKLNKLKSEARHPSVFTLELGHANLHSMGSLKRSLRKKAQLNNATLDEKLKEFRQLLIDAKNFSVVDNFFHERLVKDKRFIQAGNTQTNEKLDTVVAKILDHVFGKREFSIDGYQHISVHGFWHTVITWPERGVAVLYYFEGIDLGMVAAADTLLDPQTHYLRFSLVQPGEGAPVADRTTRGQA